jgi:hypothetical protein
MKFIEAENTCQRSGASSADDRPALRARALALGTPDQTSPGDAALRVETAAVTMHDVAALDDLKTRLLASSAAPFLFVGSGISRRYLNLDNWVELLKRMAALTGRPYGYYSSKADTTLPRVASEIAVPFHELWWTDPQFEESRKRYGDDLTTREGPLKVEVARYMEDAFGALATAGPKADELAALANVVIDGVITTNYDPLLERIFPDFVPYVGQDELLFTDPKGVGEIYQIHGSVTRPESIVLTESDYAEFNARNPYLAAKLLTIFVEHPVVFLGYSLNDSNVTEILVSIARVLTTENLGRLQDHLIFVNWDPDQREPTLVGSQIAVSGFTIPVVQLTVASFEGVFEVLANLPRRFPARLLRRLKEHVYQLVLTGDPGNLMAVVDIDDDTRADEIDVVFGVGVQARLGEHGYVGLSRTDLLVDVLQPHGYNPRIVVNDVLPRLLRHPGHTPVYLYLREAGLLQDDGTLRADAQVADRVRERVARGAPQPLEGWFERRAATLIEAAGGDFESLTRQASVNDVLLAVLGFPPGGIDLDALRAFLEANAPAFAPGEVTTAWAKAVCLYDYRRHGVDGGATNVIRGRTGGRTGARAATVRR